MIEWTNEKVFELIALLRVAAILLAVAMVALAYLRQRTLVAVLVAAITAGVFLWSINNTDWWQQRVEDEEGARIVVSGPVV